MRLDIFTLCDSVQSYSGKLVVVGAMNVIQASKLPFMVSNLSVAIRMVFEHEDKMCSTFQISIIKPGGTLLVETPKMEQNQKVPSEGDYATFDFNFGLNNVVVDEAGEYLINLKADDQLYQTKFLVKIPQK